MTDFVLAARGDMGVALAETEGAPKWWLAAGVVPLAAYQAKGAVSLAASYINLANPGTNDITAGATAPTWDATNGWVFPGNAWLDTGIVPPTGQKQWSVLVQFTGAASNGTACIFGLTSAGGSLAGGFLIVPGLGQVLYRNSGGLDKTPRLATGNLGMSYQTAYRNGAAETGAIGIVANTSLLSIYIGARHNNSNTADNFVTANVQAFIIYGSILDAAQMAAEAAAMAAL